MDYDDYGELTFSEIAKRLNLTQTQVFATYNTAIKKLKSPSLREKWNKVLETYAELKKPSYTIDYNDFEKGSK